DSTAIAANRRHVPRNATGGRLAARSVPRCALSREGLEATPLQDRVMRVLLCVHGFPPASESGSEIYAEAHASWLADRMNDDVMVLTRDNDPSCAEYHVTTERRGGYRVARLNNTFRNVTSFEDSYRNES